MNKPSVYFCAIVLVLGTLSIASANLMDGLIALYSFDGNSKDATGNGHDGTEYGGLISTTDRFGTPNSAYLFDGINDYIEIPYDPEIEPSVFTLSLWINSSIGSNGNIINSNIDAGGGTTHGYNLILKEDGKVYFSIDPSASGGDGYWLTTDSLLNDGTWHHIAAIL